MTNHSRNPNEYCLVVFVIAWAIIGFLNKKLFITFKPSVAFHRETIYLICSANQMTGFMKCITMIKSIKSANTSPRKLHRQFHEDTLKVNHTGETPTAQSLLPGSWFENNSLVSCWFEWLEACWSTTIFVKKNNMK